MRPLEHCENRLEWCPHMQKEARNSNTNWGESKTHQSRNAKIILIVRLVPCKARLRWIHFVSVNLWVEISPGHPAPSCVEGTVSRVQGGQYLGAFPAPYERRAQGCHSVLTPLGSNPRDPSKLPQCDLDRCPAARRNFKLALSTLQPLRFTREKRTIVTQLHDDVYVWHKVLILAHNKHDVMSYWLAVIFLWENSEHSLLLLTLTLLFCRSRFHDPLFWPWPGLLRVASRFYMVVLVNDYY